MTNMTNKWQGCADSGRGMNATIYIKEEMPRLKIDPFKNIAETYQCELQKLVNINYILNKRLFQLKVGHDNHTKNYYKEKL